MLHTDIPTRTDVHDLAASKGAAHVSLYLPTSPATSEAEKSRIELHNMLQDAVAQLHAAGESKEAIESIEDSVNDLIDDGQFWSYLSNSLAVFVTPDSIRTFRLIDTLTTMIEVSDRFLIKPLVKSLTFPQAAFVLALAQHSVRLVEVTADLQPHVVDVADLPDRVPELPAHRAPSGRVPFYREPVDEDEKGRIRQFTRAIDRAIRPVLAAHGVPLIVAAAEPIASIYRTTNSYPGLAREVIRGNPEEAPDADLAAASRPILDGIHAKQLAELKETMQTRSANGRAVTDLSDVARAVTYGAVDILFVDVDQTIPGTVDEDNGVITLADAEDGSNYGIVDEIVRRALLSGANIFAVRAEDVPGGGVAAASVRFAV